MEVRIYEIERRALQKLKNILEEKDKIDVEIKCEKCSKIIESKTINTDKLGEILGNDDKEQEKCECGGVINVNTKNLINNEFIRNGYILRDGKSLGVKGDLNYLYIKAEQSFFDKHEKEILIEGVKKISDSEFEKVKNEIEKEQESAAEGMGGIFNI